LTLIASLISARAATDGLHVVYDMQSAGSKMKMEYYVAEGKVRFENQTSENPLGNMVLIRRTNPEKSFMLFPKDKTFVELPEFDAEAMRKEVQAQIPFKATGQKKQIVGYSCDVMKRDLPDRKEEACTSSKLSKEYKDLQASFPKSKSGQTSLPEGLGGFPLEYKITPTNKDSSSPFHETSMLVSQLQKAPLNAALFEVPSDYLKKQFPAMPAEVLKGRKPGQGEQQIPADLQEKINEIQKTIEETKKKGTIQKQ
jgi:hypothetical protein